MRYDDYESLLNEGFTRCGSYFYIRNIQKSCCEAYQYRVALDEFEPSKAQRKVMKRFSKYLINGRDAVSLEPQVEEVKQEAHPGEVEANRL